MADPQETWARYLDADTRKSPTSKMLPPERRVPGLTILHHPDLRRVGERATLPELGSGRKVLLSRVSPEFTAPGEAARRPLADPYLSRRPWTLCPEGDGGVRLDGEGSSITVVAEGSSVDPGRSFSRSDLEQGVVLELSGRLVLLLHLLNASPPRVPRFGMVGESGGLLAVRQKVQQLTDLSGAVLIRGETGTGKELVARALHRAGARSSGPYRAVNMGAISKELAAAELFGVARGAFTGADRKRPGLFRTCHGGTLFLDEIGETPPEIQVALLRVLEEGEVRPVGSEETEQVDVRVVAATDADLEGMIEEGGFRAPLWHRLSGCEIHLPPLRQRRDDLGRLLVHFLRQELEALGRPEVLDLGDPGDEPWLSARVVAWLASRRWAGNVRQLRNVARQLVAACRDESVACITVDIERLLSEGDSPQAKEVEESSPRKTYRRSEEVSEEELLSVLRANRWRFLPTAAQLGISRTALYGLIDRFPNVRKPGDLEFDEIERSHRRCAGDLEAMVDELQVSRKGLRRRMTELGMD